MSLVPISPLFIEVFNGDHPANFLLLESGSNTTEIYKCYVIQRV